MNLEYLKKEIIPQRKEEIEKGENDMTRQPIYVVLDLQSHIIQHHSDYTSITNLKGVSMQYQFADMALDAEDRELFDSPAGMSRPQPFTQFYTDRVVAFFLTKKSAKDYLKYQSHNLSEKAYIYTFYSGYGNREMDKLLNNQ